MDEKKIEQEYRKLKQQAAPDLWNRIERNLTEHPERDENMAQNRPAESAGRGRENRGRIFTWRPAYGMAAAAAVVLVAVFANRQIGGRSMTPMKSEATETMAAMQAPEEREMASDMEQAMAPMGAEYKTASYQPLAVPEHAVTVPEDSEYFSEAILGDTDLLCGAEVTDVSLETDASGRAVKVVYEMNLDQVYYSEDYTTGMETVTVKSPIVKTEGDEAYVLYQLQKGGTYLLPLENKDGVWELLYPFAPQIQVTGDGAYLFHSGYASLVSSDASVVVGSQEGAGDYYYDRMLLRDDDNFLSDLISLVEREAQGRKQ